MSTSMISNSTYQYGRTTFEFTAPGVGNYTSMIEITLPVTSSRILSICAFTDSTNLVATVTELYYSKARIRVYQVESLTQTSRVGIVMYTYK